jgi:hypothetical protein
MDLSEARKKQKRIVSLRSERNDERNFPAGFAAQMRHEAA